MIMKFIWQLRPKTIGGMRQLFNYKHRANALLTVVMMLTAMASVTLFNLTYLARQREVNHQLVQEYQRQTRNNLKQTQTKSK